MTEPAFLKPRLKATLTVGSIAIELNTSRCTFSSIDIELKIDGQCALKTQLKFDRIWINFRFCSV